VHLDHVAEDVVERLRVEYGNGERITDEVQRIYAGSEGDGP